MSVCDSVPVLVWCVGTLFVSFGSTGYVSVITLFACVVYYVLSCARCAGKGRMCISVGLAGRLNRPSFG